MIEKRLKDLKIELPDVPVPVGSYTPCLRHSDLVFVSGQLPFKDGKLVYKGKVGGELDIEQGKEAARIASINILSILQKELGSLDVVLGVLRLTGYVSSAEGFNRQADVLNGASQLFSDVFGSSGVHTRVAVGVYELPLGAPVEIEAIVAIRT